MDRMSSWFYTEQWPSLSTPTDAVMFLTMLTLIAVGAFLLYSPIDSLVLSLDRRRKGRSPLPPGSFGLPIAGELRPFLKDRISFREKRHAKYGPVFKTNILGKTVFMEPPAGTKFLFANDGRLVESSFPPSTIKLLGPNSMMVLTGNTHKLARRHMAPFFTPQALERYLPRLEQHLQSHLNDVWRPAAGEHDGEEFELSISKSLELLTYDIIADLLLSPQPRETEELQQLQRVWMVGFGRIPINVPGTTYYRGLKARTRMSQILGSMLSRRRVELKEGTASPSQDFMSYLLTQPDDNGRLYTDEEIIDNIIFLFLAGHGTPATSLALVLRFIALLPDVRQRLKDEVDAIAKQKKDGEGLTKENLAEMKYAWRVIQESMRMHSAQQGSFRKALEDIEYGGYSIPKGWKIAWTVHSHRDPKSFKDPNTFDPSRFDGGQKILPYSYIPFGGGPHICIGNEFAKMEMLVIVYYVMKAYTFTLGFPDEPFFYFPFSSQRAGTRLRLRKLNAET